MQKVAFALAAILAFGGVVVSGHWWLGNKATMHAQSKPPLLVVPTPSDSSQPVPPAGSQLPSLAVRQSAPAIAHASTVSVKPGETLFEICFASFGRCSPELLQEIRRLNPQMKNLDHIEPGQTIQLPLSVANLEQARAFHLGEQP